MMNSKINLNIPLGGTTENYTIVSLVSDDTNNKTENESK